MRFGTTFYILGLSISILAIGCTVKPPTYIALKPGSGGDSGFLNTTFGPVSVDTWDLAEKYAMKDIQDGYKTEEAFKEAVLGGLTRQLAQNGLTMKGDSGQYMLKLARVFVHRITYPPRMVPGPPGPMGAPGPMHMEGGGVDSHVRFEFAVLDTTGRVIVEGSTDGYVATGGFGGNGAPLKKALDQAIRYLSEFLSGKMLKEHVRRTQSNETK